LSVAPYYNKPSQNGIFLHYKTIASVSPVPVIIYNVPGRTSVNIDADTTLKLANEVKNIIATKEASGDLAQIMEIIKNRPDGFKVISGDDALTLTMIMLGGDGVISVIANACPQEFSSMVKYALNGDCAKAREIHYQLLDLINALFEEGSPAGVKALLSMKGYIENSLRLPLTPISNELNQKIKNLI
ncbi:MAG: 4-hydroxy-tetrahydrodipicolinate synthase, partial [Bacteroidota bacterium]